MNAESKHWTPKLIEIAGRLNVLRDRVIVSRIDYEHPVLAVVGVVLQKGLVVAVGYGRRTRRKHGFQCFPGGPTQYYEDGNETGEIRPMKVRVGQHVEFSPRNCIEFTFEGVPLVQVWQEGVYGTTTDSQSDALLWQQSAGYDRDGNFMSGRETSL